MSDAPEPRSAADPGPLRIVPQLVGIALLFVALTAAAVAVNYRQERKAEGARIQAIADLRARQVSRWLNGRMSVAAFLLASQTTADLFLHGQGGDKASLDRLVERMVDMRRATGFQQVLIFDASAQAVAAETGADTQVSVELRDAVRRALASGKVERTELYGFGGAAPAPRIDVVAPLNVTGKPARAAIALRLDPEVFLFPELRAWPVPSASGEALLARRVGDRVVISSEGRSFPISADILSARSLRGDTALRVATDGLDYRGTPVLGAVSPVAGSDWYVVAKVGLDEIRGAARQGTILIVGLGSLSFLVVALMLRAARQRFLRQGDLADLARREDKMRTLQLLDAIARGSTDAIVGKSLDGTVLSWNPGAEQLFGYSAEEMIGRPVSLLIPDDRRDEEEGILVSVARGERVESLETLRRKKNGELVAVSLNISPIRDLAGTVVGISKIARDMSERRRLESALRERESSLARAQVMAQLGHLIVGPGGVIESWSETLPRLFGIAPAAMPKTLRDWLQLVHPDDRVRLRENMLKGAATGARSEFAYRARRGDGEWIDLRQEMEPIESAPGEPPSGRWFGTIQDVTGQVRAENRLRESAAFVQAVADSVVDHMAVLDRAGVIVSINAAWKAFALANGMDGETLARRAGVGADYLALCHRAGDTSASNGEAVAAGIAAVIAGTRERFSFEYACHSPDEERWFLMNATPLKTAAGGAVVVHSDITERKRNQVELERHRDKLEEMVAARSGDLIAANRALHEAEAFLRMVADNIPGRVAYWNRDTTCAFVNRAYCEWFRLRREDILGKTMSEIFGAEYLAQRWSRVAAVLGGEEQHFEREERSADGTRADTWVHYIPDRQAGEVRGFFVLATDISELKKAELRLLLANQELVDARDRSEAATAAKSAFLAHMSHEIRTPMNAIIGLTHLLSRDTHVPAQRERLGKVADAAHHLLGVINDILDLSKIESGKLKLEARDFRLDAMLERVCALVADSARAKGLELVIDSDSMPQQLNGDVTRLSQALLNLLSNAVKFTARGSVTLRSELIARQPESLLVRFEVRDTGVGIPADRIDRIFDAFEQADASTTRRFGGTGLGLSITRQLAALMGGEAGAHSVLGAGSTFWFSARLARARNDAEPAPDLNLRGTRVLLVDDLVEAREALAEMLRRLGTHVDAVSSGEEALALSDAARSAGEPHALCVLDWKMPGMDGIETWRRLGGGPGGAAMRCVLVTAHDEESLWHEAREAGIGKVLVKPISMSTLLDALSEALASNPPVQAVAPESGDALASLLARGIPSRVLLAEDNPINREVAVELLRSAGLEVDVAVNGVEAVAMAQAGDYALILMDVQMPEMDGLQAARLLRAPQARRVGPIVAMTANAFDEDREACLQAGMDDHLAKPVDPEALFQTLLRWLPGESAAAAVPAARPAALPEAVAAEPSWPTRRARLEAVAGLDVDLGMQLFGGHTEMYTRVLALFADTYASGSPQLEPGQPLGAAGALAAVGHSIRGASSSIGARRVEAAAAVLESLGKTAASPAELDTASAALQSLLMETARQIGRALVD
jgi:PAS domain S-box-containing protein